MAKKDKNESEEAYEFTPPDFDEDAFIHRELVSFKTTGILVGWAILVAVISWFVHGAIGGTSGAWWASVALAAAGGYALKFIYPLLKAETDHFGRKEWTGTGFLFFFTWLAIMILLMNPPFTDHAEPHVEILLGPPVQQIDQPVNIDIFALDNGAVDRVAITIKQGSNVVLRETDFQVQGDRWTLRGHTFSPGEYNVTAVVTDTHGNQATVSKPLKVSRQAVAVNIPADGNLDSRSDIIELVMPSSLPPCTAQRILSSQACIRSAWADLGNGNVVLLNPSEDAWTAGVEDPGWELGATNNFTIHAQLATRFVGKELVESSRITTGSRSVFVAEGVLPDGGIGEPAFHLPDLDEAPIRQVPGPEVAVLAVGILLVAAVVARRRH